MKQILVIFIILNSFACKQMNKVPNRINSIDVKIYETNFMTNKIKTSEIPKIEKKNSGVKYTKPINNYLSKDYFPDIDKYDFAQPIIYQRDTLNLNTEISYYFTKKDSIVRLIEYSWNTNWEIKNQKPFINDLYSLNNSFIAKKMKQNSKEEFQKFNNGWRKSKNWENQKINIYIVLF
ncbi:hypothetical protein [Epilithonimonas lactis]|nr:hypothetical protein [Epilithonimonas lactis]